MNAFELPEKFNAASYFVDRNLEKGYGDRTAIIYCGQEITYEQVGDMVNRTGNALLDLGVGMEERVIMLLLDTPEFVYSFWGAIKAGIVPVPANTNLKAQDYLYILNDSRAAALIIDESVLTEVEQILPQCIFLRHVIVVGKCNSSHLCYGKITSQASAVLEAAPTSKDDMAFWLYSSGTTGFPKGVVHLQHDMVYSCEHYAKQILSIHFQDRTYSVSKLFFAYGLGNGLYYPFYVGASTVLNPNKPDPADILDTIRKYNPTIFYAVPTVYANLLPLVDKDSSFSLGTIKFCISAGEALPASLYDRWFKRFWVEILDGIGSTEAGHTFISNKWGMIRAGSTGVPVPGYEIKLIDDQGEEIARGEIGNLLVKGDSIAAYYWNKHEKTKQTFRGEWLFTGDKYYQDKDGFYWYAGRSDDMLKIGGIWVSPIEVENTINEYPEVLECAVIGVENHEGLVKTRAYVVPVEGVDTSEDFAQGLREFIRERLAHYKCPKQIEFVQELPKTATGKIQRYKLRQLAAGER